MDYILHLKTTSGTMVCAALPLAQLALFFIYMQISLIFNFEQKQKEGLG